MLTKSGNKEESKSGSPSTGAGVGQTANKPARVSQHIVEIVSDSGEGAQKAGQAFAAACAKNGNGVWTVEIIPAEIKPPARSKAGASGIRVRVGSKYVTNMGDEAELVVALNEQVLFGRIDQRAFKPGTIILLESKWAQDGSEEIRQQYADAVKEFRDVHGYVVEELAFEEACLEFTNNPRLGKNMFVLGMLCRIYGIELRGAEEEIEYLFARKGAKVVDTNKALLHGGARFAENTMSHFYEVPIWSREHEMLVTNGNQAVGLGVMASGMELVSMYPITPATSASHYLAGALHMMGGCVHQAEDEIAAIGFAIGASYAGKTACTITSGPGLALKTEFLGLAVMAEVPLVIVLVQRGGPSTGLPTKVEQGDLLAVLYGAPGDAPKIVIAPATIEECLHFVVTARKLAEQFRMPVLVLTDTNLATGVQPFPRPKITEDWLAPPLDQSPWDKNVDTFDWDEKTGLSPRPIPGQAGGEYTLTGLAHTTAGKVAYDPESNQKGCAMRSRKLATLHKTLKAPPVHGDEEGELLVVGWGSTWGAIEEAVDRVRDEGGNVSSMHIRFLSPLHPGLKEIFAKFKNVFTVEINYSDEPDAPLINAETRRYAQLAWHLRAHTLMDIDCWSNVYGQPLQPGRIYDEIKRRLNAS